MPAPTAEITMTGTWQRIATTGFACVTVSKPALWRVTANTTSPAASAGGHVIEAWVDRSWNLGTSEHLWINGPLNGAAYVSADAPV